MHATPYVGAAEDMPSKSTFEVFVTCYWVQQHHNICLEFGANFSRSDFEITQAKHLLSIRNIGSTITGYFEVLLSVVVFLQCNRVKVSRLVQ